MEHKHKRALRIAVLVIIIAVLVGCYVFIPDFFHIIYLLMHGNMRESIHFIKSYGPYAMVVTFLIIVAINLVAVLPNIFILAATGIVFGVVEGTIISWLAESVGVTLSFILMRYLFREQAHMIIARSPSLQKFDEFSGRKGLRVMLIARSIPFIPSGAVTALGALSSIGLRDYVIATFVGKILSVWIEVTLGHDLVSYREHIPRLIFLTVLSGLGYFFFRQYKKNKQ